MQIGYHASHEQFAPSTLLSLVQKAESAGFKGMLCSDHFHPWSDQQGESGFAWSWLGAAMLATQQEYGIVNAPGQRYHPAIIAQAAATLEEMFPGRFWIAVGSGQHLNEHITGTQWPSKDDRNARLQESVAIMRKLWKGEEVSQQGHITIKEAKLYTLPKKAPKVIGAAITAKTAGWMGNWVDGIITTSKPLRELEEFVETFQENGGKGKSMYMKMQISYHPDAQQAYQGAFEQWRSNIFPSKVTAELRMPDQFDAVGTMVSEEDIRKNILIGDSADTFIEHLAAYQELGFERIFVHNVNLEQEQYIDFFGREVLPAFR